MLQYFLFDSLVLLILPTSHIRKAKFLPSDFIMMLDSKNICIIGIIILIIITWEMSFKIQLILYFNTV